MKLQCMLTLLLVLCSFAAVGNLNTVITRNDTNEWTVTYTAKFPVKKIVFNRNPNDSRTTRWNPFSDKFVVSYQNNQEFIQRTDGQDFTSVSLMLTPTYTPLPKEYAPFSPFSDGGMLFHSARLFACIESCLGTNTWNMSVSAGKHDNIIVNGELFIGKAQWTDSNSGQKIYVGESQPKSDALFVSIIDERLPASLQTVIATKLPALMRFFTEKLGPLDYKPSLFASYSESINGEYGRQGGTLDSQIFMHWYGKPSIENINSDSTYWFFAHEVAHIFQRRAANIESTVDAWIHEGAAELFAGLASEQEYFLDALSKAKAACKTTLEGGENYQSIAAKNPKVHYSCGLVIMNAINSDLKVKGEITIFDLWLLFDKRVAQGSAANSKVFIETLQPYVSEELFRVLDSFSKEGRFPWL